MVNMKRKAQQEEQVEEEEESRNLTINSCKVIEYLEPSMSKELHFKFPDNSAFDFDYSQSSIWSPLVPRVHSPMDLITPKKLTFGFGFGFQSDNYDDDVKKKKKKKRNGSIKVTSTMKKKLKLKLKKQKTTNNGMLIKAPKFSPTPIKAGCALFAAKGWNKVLKAASKHFKKQKKKDPAVHVKLSNYLWDFDH